MACTTAWGRQNKATERIAGERRLDRRYAILLDLRWKLIRRKRVLESGIGSTLDLSSSGILFESSRQLPQGLDVELAISWPVLLHNIASMQLVVQGRIVRSAGGRVAIRMSQHEFRTVGVPGNHNTVSSHATSRQGPFLATVNGAAAFVKIQ